MQEYNGWPSYETWAVYTHLTSYDSVRVEAESMAVGGSLEQAAKRIQDYVQVRFQQYSKGQLRGDQKRCFQGLLTDIGAGASLVVWSKVTLALRGE